MKRRIITACACLLVVLFLSVPLTALADEMPGPDPTEVWNYITKVSPYTKWAFWPDHQGVQPGRAPHGPFHKVYVNDRALNSTRPPLQYGSMQVKESYSKDMKLMNITVMYKVHGYNPPDGDWYWAKYTPEGKAISHGKPRNCIGCHGTRAKNDFVVVHEFK